MIDRNGLSCKVTVLPYGVEIVVPPQTNLAEAIRKTGLPFMAPCGEKGTCGKCKVLVLSGKDTILPPSSEEIAVLNGLELKGYRLACRVHLRIGHVKVAIQQETLLNSDQYQLQNSFLDLTLKPEPQIIKIPCTLPVVSGDQGEGYRDRLSQLLQCLNHKGNRGSKFNLQALKQIGKLFPVDEHVITLVSRSHNAIIAIEEGDTGQEVLGLGIDLGTTKIALYLIDLLTGSLLSSASTVNPQIQYGEDLMTRLSYCLASQENIVYLQKAVFNAINSLISRVCDKAGRKQEHIYDLSVVGNPCMIELFLGITPQSLAFAPFLPVDCHSRTIEVSGFEISLFVNSSAEVYVLPAIGGFVGADNVAAQLSTGFHRQVSKGAWLLMDIGTNTEIVLKTPHVWLACSCASGSAFEGMHIKHGQKAVIGAINKVLINDVTYEVVYQTIGGEKPCGICGTGLIDTLAELLRIGIIEPTGRFKKGIISKRLRSNPESGTEFVLCWQEETEIEQDVVISEKDIYELLQAKAAIRTGCEMLLKVAGVNINEIEELVIAGAFGEYLDAINAIRIGLLPKVPIDRIRIVGNAAGRGAVMVLVAQSYSRLAEEIALQTTHYNLSRDDNFMSEYSRYMFLNT
ncbi:DUF4445 domain-containing protein [candidate division WWE3 bacterium]|jgi:uncharacterized 2Fe-2S/4Fe-4S cluster protein (DUF4445 family)|uniref:DUF4445 domain-containing protein n=1 Tax=candidate division WWE3 bacterium TaxID=2053526 RepID=A0A3A4ZL05_UNCKA|nr:MAG: DUF4445 domain-containing protein [candidate division WWE3 bacterium]